MGGPGGRWEAPGGDGINQYRFFRALGKYRGEPEGDERPRGGDGRPRRAMGEMSTRFFRVLPF